MTGKTLHFIGVDISKLYVDASLLTVVDHVKKEIVSERFENTHAGMKTFSKWLKNYKVSFNGNTLLVIENTGIYHRLLWAFCCNKKIPIHIGNAAHIKWSFGIARGKNDKIDSIRLSLYAFKEADMLRAAPSLNPVLMQLKDLVTARTKLLSQINSIKVYIKELKNVSDPGIQKTLERAHRQAITGMEASIKNLEAEIKLILAKHTDFKKNYDLLISVPGIGHLTAIYLICCTNNFVSRISGKQLASYAGVVPFEHSSGTSVRGRNKVHPMANKDLKKALHLCALTAMKNYPEFKIYYQRKKAEGKHSMSILNAIRNKIALRAAAVINKQMPYVTFENKAA
jgi:transposase